VCRLQPRARSPARLRPQPVQDPEQDVQRVPNTATAPTAQAARAAGPVLLEVTVELCCPLRSNGAGRGDPAWWLHRCRERPSWRCLEHEEGTPPPARESTNQCRPGTSPLAAPTGWMYRRCPDATPKRREAYRTGPRVRPRMTHPGGPTLTGANTLRCPALRTPVRGLSSLDWALPQPQPRDVYV
jgi:hypothetical protein